MKFTLYIDYKAGSTYGQNGIPYNGLKIATMNAANVYEAMAEADAQWTEDVYLMRIMEKHGKAERVEGGFYKQLYKATLCRRSRGWYLNTAENHECEHYEARYYGKGCEWFETECHREV